MIYPIYNIEYIIVKIPEIKANKKTYSINYKFKFYI